jgi:mannose/fructose/N-acetylgalactosamine-specific phosphotransferase system component IIC
VASTPGSTENFLYQIDHLFRRVRVSPGSQRYEPSESIVPPLQWSARDRLDHRRVNYLAQIGTFLLRGVLPFLVLFLGSGFAQSVISFLNVQVPWLFTYLGLLGGALPAVGIAILLLQIAPSARLLVWFLLGWVLVVYLKVPTVGVAVIGVLVALIYYWFFSRLETEPDQPQKVEA